MTIASVGQISLICIWDMCVGGGNERLEEIYCTQWMEHGQSSTSDLQPKAFGAGCAQEELTVLFRNHTEDHFQTKQQSKKHAASIEDQFEHGGALVIVFEKGSKIWTNRELSDRALVEALKHD